MLHSFIITVYQLCFRTGKNYYPKVFLKECKYVVKEKMPEYFTNDVKISSDDSDREDSDQEN